MVRKINQHMVAQIKIKWWHFIIMTFLYLPSNAQISNCIPLKILNDFKSKNLKSNDTIQIRFQNVSKDTIQYQMDVMMFNNSEWSYSPYYTRYFNHDLSYAKMKNIYRSKLPVVFTKNYYHPACILKPNEIGNIIFEVGKPEPYKKLIKFRLHILNGKDKCDMIFFAPFYFVKIKE